MEVQATVPYQNDGIGEALAEYEMAREEGRQLDHRAFLSAHADIAAELAPLLDAAERIDRLAGRVREALVGKLSLAVPAPG